MSYIEQKTRLFNSLDEPPEVPRKRSDGRLKTYGSATDTRAWSDISEEQRIYILDLVKEGGGKGLSLGKYIPIDVLIDTLLANKNAEILRLQQELDAMRGGLTAEQFAAKAAAAAAAAAAGAAAGAGAAGGTDKSGIEATVSSTGGAGGKGTEGTQGTSCDAASDLNAYSKEELKQMIIEKDAEIISLENALAAKEEDCENQRRLARTAIEKLETVKDIIDERNSLKKQLEESAHQLETLKKKQECAASKSPQRATTSKSEKELGSCEEEIAAMEKEIERLKTTKTKSPEAEAEIIRKELNVLKKYCAKLSTIQCENNQLKRQMESFKKSSKPGNNNDDALHQQPEKLNEIKNNIQSIIDVDLKLTNLRNRSVVDDCDENNDKAAMKSRIAELELQIKTYNDTVTERDGLKARVQELEEELSKYGHLPQEVEVLKRKSIILDEVMEERDSLHTRLNHLQNVEKQVIELKKKAARVDELERLLKELQCNTKELQNIKAERDMLRMKAADHANMEQEIERLRYRAKEAEVLRIERDRMKVRLDELAAIEVEFMQLLDRTKCLETIKAEREMYKKKYEELLGVQCECEVLMSQMDRAKAICIEKDMLEERVQDCECLIAEQENEINKLLCHIDRLSQGHEEQQCLRKYMEKIKMQQVRHGRRSEQISRKYGQCERHG